MPYTPTIFSDEGPPAIDASQMNRLGAGVAEALAKAEEALNAAATAVDSTVIYAQNTPLAQWSVPHPLNRLPQVSLYVSGQLCLADTDVTSNSVTVTFPAPTAGVLVLS